MAGALEQILEADKRARALMEKAEEERRRFLAETLEQKRLNTEKSEKKVHDDLEAYKNAVEARWAKAGLDDGSAAERVEALRRKGEENMDRWIEEGFARVIGNGD